MMNLFNQFNCRKLGVKEYNIFSNFFNNFAFLLIVSAEFVATIAIVNLGGTIFRTTPLNATMFFTTIAFGAGSLLVGVILKATPESWVEKIKLELDEEGLNEGTDIISKVQNKVMGSLKKSETERLLDSQ